MSLRAALLWLRSPCRIWFKDKGVGVIVDNAANMDLALRQLQITKLGCLADTLNLGLYYPNPLQVDCKHPGCHSVYQEIIHHGDRVPGEAAYPW